MRQRKRHRMTKANSKSSIEPSLSGAMTIHKNLDQNILAVSEDKLRLCLIEHREALSSRLKWLTPFTLLLSLVATISTSTFHETAGIKPESWFAVFLICSVLSLIWFLYEIAKMIVTWKNGSVDKLIQSIKNNTEQ